MISKHLLISIFLVTSLFAGSKTKRDKGKSDSEPTSGDAKDIVDKSKLKNREEKLGKEEGEQKDTANKPGKQEDAADTAGEQNDAANTGGQEDAAGKAGEHADAADTAGEFTEGGNETPKVNRLIENADESGGEAEHLEVKSEGEDPLGAEEEEEEEADDDQVSDHPEEVRPDEEEGEEGEPKGEPANEAELHKDGGAKVESVDSDADEIFSGAEAVENVLVGDEVDASANPAVETPSAPVEPIECAPQTPQGEEEEEAEDDQVSDHSEEVRPAHEPFSSASKASEIDVGNDAAASAPPADWTYSSPGTAFKGLQSGDEIQVSWNDVWCDAKFLQMRPNGDLSVKFDGYSKPSIITTRHKKAQNFHQIRKRN